MRRVRMRPKRRAAASAAAEPSASPKASARPRRALVREVAGATGAIDALSSRLGMVVLALGCNVALVANPGEEREGKIALLNQAITELCSLPDSQIVDISSFYVSEPAYYEDQDEFVNAIALVRCGVPPAERCSMAMAGESPSM